MTIPRLTLRQCALAYVIALLTQGALDAVWLGWLARDFYAREMGSMMADPIRVWPAAAFYLGYPAGVVYLVLMRVPETLGNAALRCAVFGLVAFGVYDMTTLSVLRGWTVPLSLVDLAYGTVATALAGGLAYRVVVGRAAA